jgi:lysophospholipase L1-like esterase
MIRPLTDHEYKINAGAWTGCISGNTTDNGDGTYTIHSGLNVDIPIGGLKVRVKTIGINPPSSELSNSVAFNAPSSPKSIQLIFIGDSITAGQGTTTNGDSVTGPLFGANSYPVKTISKLSSLDVTPFYRGFPGGYQSLYLSYDLATTISIFDKHNYTDIYCILFFGANDLLDPSSVAPFQSDIATISNALKEAGAKVIVMPVLSRKDTFAASVSYGNITRRNIINTWLVDNYTDFADGLIDLSPYPEIFADAAPDNATYFNDSDTDGLYKVHPTDVGADILATAAADAVIELSETTSLPIEDTDDAATFITATGISDGDLIAAIEQFVTDLKEAKLWNRLAVIYPFVGGTATTHKFNLKDPRDLDAAARLEFFGSPIHNSNGVTWASGAYADTKYIPPYGNYYNASNYSLHYYSRTASPSSAGIDIGVNPARIGIKLGGAVYDECNSNFIGGTTVSYDETGLFTTSRYSQNSHVHTLYRNGVFVHDKSIDGRANMPIHPQFIGAENEVGSIAYPSNRNCGYCAIGYGLTADEEAAHYAAVQAFQTALGRAV